MGIIKRQSIKSTLVNYLGVVAGAVAVLFVYPLNDEIYGYANWLYSTSYLLFPLASGGVISLVVKYFPTFNQKESRNFNGFLSLIIALILVVYTIFLGFWFLFKPQLLAILDILKMDSGAIVSYEPFVLIFLFVLIVFLFLINHSYNQLRTVVPNIIHQLGYKLYLPLLVLAYIYFEMTIEQFSWALIGFFVMACLLMAIYLNYLKALKFGMPKRPKPSFSFKSMASYSVFGSLNGLSNSLAFRIDNVIIPLLLDMAKNGVYNKVYFMSNVIEMPIRAINQIAGPVISKAWEENDMKEISTVYKKASNNLFLVGCFFFIILWFILDDLIAISSNPDAFPNARMIFLFLALGKLVDMLMSVNSQIIIYSRHYKFNLYFLLFLGGSNLVLNYILINKYGLVGAAVATATSLLVYNLLKLGFIQLTFRIHPFSTSTIKTFILLLSFIGLYYILDFSFNPFINIGIKCIAITCCYAAIAYYTNISEDINSIIRTFIQKINLRKWN